MASSANKLTGAAFLAELEAPMRPVKLGYIFREGVRSLSYSRLLTFYSCPRKFHLGETQGAREFSPTIDTAFGHAFGMGVQTYLVEAEKGNLQTARARAIVAAISAYDYGDIFEETVRSKKCLDYAIIGVLNFIEQTAPLILSEYKVATINGKPAVELMFLIDINERTDYQGHIDLVLQHRTTNELYVLEIKTKAGDSNPWDWQNSMQTLGYNVVLHTAFPQGTNFNVFYLCYNTLTLQCQGFAFTKSIAHRAEFITTLLQDVQQMDVYEEHDHWPKRGSNCGSWGKACYLFGRCDNKLLEAAVEQSYEGLPPEAADIHITMEQLLQQLTDETSTTDDIDWENMQ